MSRFLSVVWGMQVFALLVLSGVLLVAPKTVPLVLDNCTIEEGRDSLGGKTDVLDCPPSKNPPPPPDSWKEISFLLTSVQLLVPFMLTLAAFSLHAFMREDLRVRRQMARIFALTGSVFVCLLLNLFDKNRPSLDTAYHITEHSPVWRTPLLAASFGLLVLFTLSNLALALWPLPRSAQQLSGSADTRPSQLWILWLIQGLGFCLLAACLTQVELVKFVVELKDPVTYDHVLNDIRQLAPPLFLSIGLFSFMGMGASREWGWRAFTRLFVIFYVSWFLVLLFVWQQEFKALVLLFLIPVLLLMAGNMSFWRKSDTWFAEEVGEGPDGWVLVDLLVGPMLMWKTVFTRRRALYACGVAAQGTLHVTDYVYGGSPYGPALAQEFFSPGQQFKARVRFSTHDPDDAALAPRGVALLLSGTRQGSFDIMLGTGAYSAAENIVQFALLCLAHTLGGFAERLLWKYSPRLREGMIAALRRAPDSYALMHYHSQTIRFWVAQDGTRHLVRYRLVPEHRDERGENGIPKPGEDDPARRGRLKHERRPLDYLRQEMKRLLEGPRKCTLRLEAQFHTPDAGNNIHWFNPATDWREDEHPWVCIGHLVLEEALPDDEAEQLCFNPANVPPSLGTPISRGFFDYRSLADSEKRIHRRLQKTRVWLATSLGLPTLAPTPHDPS